MQAAIAGDDGEVVLEVAVRGTRVSRNQDPSPENSR
jgi:hypothetical protein